MPPRRKASVSTNPAERPQLRQEDQLWITSEINQPSWNFISGFAFFFFSAGLVYTVLTSPLSVPAKTVATLASLLIVVPGIYFIRIGLARIVPLRRLRKAVAPIDHLTVEAVYGHSPDVLIVELSNGHSYLVTGPAVNFLAHTNVLHGSQRPDDLSFDFFATPPTAEDAAAAPVRMLIADRGAAVGNAEWYGTA